MSKKTVGHALDALPPLTERQRRHLDAMNALPDDRINLADIPELTDDQLAEMKQAAHYRPVKNQITSVLTRTCWLG